MTLKMENMSLLFIVWKENVFTVRFTASRLVQFKKKWLQGEWTTFNSGPLCVVYLLGNDLRSFFYSFRNKSICIYILYNNFTLIKKFYEA